MTQRLSTFRKIACVVKDMEEALKYWTKYLKAGPFFTLAPALAGKLVVLFLLAGFPFSLWSAPYVTWSDCESRELNKCPYVSALVCESRASARCDNYFDVPENAIILGSEDYEVAFNPGGWLRIAPTGNHRITKVFAQCALSCDHRFRDELGYGEDLLKSSIKVGDSRKVSRVSRKCRCVGTKVYGIRQ